MGEAKRRKEQGLPPKQKKKEKKGYPRFHANSFFFIHIISDPGN